MSHLKPKTINVFVHNVDYLEASGDEVTIEVRGVKKAPKGSKETIGKGRIRLRLVFSSYRVGSMAKAGRKGLEKLAENAEGRARYLRREIERLGGAT